MLDSFDQYISENIDSSKILPYAPSEGTASLRGAWQKHQRKMNPKLQQSTLPVVCAGLTHGLSLTAELFFDEGSGDKIILPESYWGNYRLIWQTKKQTKLITYSFFDPELKKFNVTSFKETLEKNSSTDNKTGLLFNFPQNPTGYSLKREEALEILKLLKEQANKGKKFLAICDDAYWGLCYEEGLQKESLFSELAQLHENILAVKIDGCTKEFFMWGMRVAFLSYGFKGMTDDCAYALERKTAAAIRGNISSSTHHSQELLLKLLTSENIYEEKLAKEKALKKRYKSVKEEVSKECYKDLWQPYPFNSGYFMCLKLKNDLASEKLRTHLLDEYQTGIIALAGNDIRIAFSCLAF